MLILAAVLYLLIAPVLAGALVLIAVAAPSLGLMTLESIGMLAGAGFAAGVLLALIMAAVMKYRKPRALG